MEQAEEPAVPTISSPLRILLLSVDEAGLPSVFPHDLETFKIRTAYYNADIPIWRDEIERTAERVKTWEREWIGDKTPTVANGKDTGERIQNLSGDTEDGSAADGHDSDVDDINDGERTAVTERTTTGDEDATAEVVGVIGAWVVVFRKPSDRFWEKGKASGAEQTKELKELRNLLTTIHRVFQHHRQSSALAYSNLEPIFLAVGVRQTIITSSTSLNSSLGMDSADNDEEQHEQDAWDELCSECGEWEWIDCSSDDVGEGATLEGSDAKSQAGTRNAFGEKVGVERLREVLESNEWEKEGEVESNDEGEIDFDVDETREGDEDGFGIFEAALIGAESETFNGQGKDDTKAREPFLGKTRSQKDALAGPSNGHATVNDGLAARLTSKEEEAQADAGDDDEVREMENVMIKLQAVRDLGSDMPEAERRRFAAKAVREVMRKL